ncbi:protein of unknown function [Latilactobacillus sakei]|nr:protein of unknown function [Latilactobacillus sakei]
MMRSLILSVRQFLLVTIVDPRINAGLIEAIGDQKVATGVHNEIFELRSALEQQKVNMPIYFAITHG